MTGGGGRVTPAEAGSGEGDGVSSIGDCTSELLSNLVEAVEDAA